MSPPHRNIIVIGASAGGLSALLELVRGLPGDLPASLFVVIHTSPDSPSVLPMILRRAGSLPAELAVDREPIVPGRIYVAPPDHHLTLHDDHVRVRRGPRENGFRPAVDPLFRSAAHVHGRRTIAVVLSGGLNDGTHGMALVAHSGGVTIVQDPQEALVPSMPLSALQAVEVRHVCRAAEIAPILVHHVRESVDAELPTPTAEPEVAEIGSSLRQHPPPGNPSLYTCPDCGGALWEVTDATRILRFRCHVGHAYSAEGLLSSQDGHLDAALWSALRALEEHAALYRRMAARTADAGMAELARIYADQVQRTEQRADIIRAALQHAPPQPPDPGTPT